MRDGLGGVQSVLVLGGRSELALATVRLLVADRCRTVVLGVRDPGAATAEVDELRAAGATEVEAIEFDALDVDRHAAAIQGAFDAHGGFDLVLLAFGVLGDQDRLDADPLAAVDLVCTNYVGVVSAGLVLARTMRAAGHGTIVVFSSVAGVRVRRDNLVYGSSKAGVDGFALGLGDRLAGSGVRVMVVRPGFVTTRMTAGLDPAPMATTAEAVAEAVVAGLRRNATAVWAPAGLRWVFAGLRLLPGAAWRRLPGT